MEKHYPHYHVEIKRQSDFPHLRPSFQPLYRGTFKVGDLITNINTKAAWRATQYDVDTIFPGKWENHLKFRKMIPIM